MPKVASDLDHRHSLRRRGRPDQLVRKSLAPQELFEAPSGMRLTATTHSMALDQFEEVKSMRIIRNLIAGDIPPTQISGKNRPHSPHRE
jgi:hypothetical protein